MSAKGVRKCKACNQAVKGHLGPYGLGKCTLGKGDKNDNSEEKIEKEVEKPRGEREGRPTLQEDTEVLEYINKEAVPDLSKNITKLPSPAKKTGDDSPDMYNEEVNREFGERINLIDNVEDNKKEEVNNSMTESEDDKISHFLEETGKKDDNEDYTVPTETNESKMDDCSYVEPSFFLGDSPGGQKEEDRIRLMSVSDSDIDISNLLKGRTFVLCRCDNTDCDCDGEVEFPEDSLEGEVTELYFDPLDNNLDYKPTLKLAKKGWNKEKPNIVRLNMGGITAPGVIASAGELVLTASRVVEMVKGRRELSTDLRGSLSLQLKVSSLYTKKGVRSPIIYKDIECFLYMLDKLDEVHDDQDRPGMSTGSEDNGEDIKIE